MTCCVPDIANRPSTVAGEVAGFDLAGDGGANDFIEGVINESLQIGAAPVNIYKLLGIYSQHMLVDVTGAGDAISSGEFAEFAAMNAYTNDASEWKSTQKGANVLSHAWIGYDFGPILLPNDRLRYGIETEEKRHVTSIMIQQGCDAINRAVRARIERSNDGIKWFGVALVDLINDGASHWVNVKQSAASRYWRVRPVVFNSTGRWVIKRLAMSEFLQTDISNVQDEMGFHENRDRKYSVVPVQIKGFYDLVELQSSLARWGIEVSSQFTFRFGFNTIVNALGRPPVIGDVLEIPSEVQYDPHLKQVKRYVEVTDVAWSTQGYTPGWKPTLYSVTTMPLIASQETRDIVGNLNIASTDNDFFNLSDSLFDVGPIFADEIGRAAGDTMLAQVGEDTNTTMAIPLSDVITGLDAGVDVTKLNNTRIGIYVEDAMPPDGLPYTEGPSYPTAPNDGDYHRLTYVGVKDPIPVRLYKYSLLKNRWVFMEEDRRGATRTKPQIQEFIKHGVDVTTLR